MLKLFPLDVLGHKHLLLSLINIQPKLGKTDLTLVVVIMKSSPLVSSCNSSFKIQNSLHIKFCTDSRRHLPFISAGILSDLSLMSKLL
jgi:hypothetical protein